MSISNDELADELKGMLGQSGRATAFGDEEAPAAEDENPLESDFFRAINAFRAARESGDAARMAEAEEHLRTVVRGELTGEACAGE